VALSVNYRSGIGYGLNFREALNYGAGGASEFSDVMGAGLFLKLRQDAAAAPGPFAATLHELGEDIRALHESQ